MSEAGAGVLLDRLLDDDPLDRDELAEAWEHPVEDHGLEGHRAILQRLEQLEGLGERQVFG